MTARAAALLGGALIVVALIAGSAAVDVAGVATADRRSWGTWAGNAIVIWLFAALILHIGDDHRGDR